MSECYCAMMRESSLDKYVTIETSHFRNSEYTNCSKGTSCNRKNLAVCNVSTKFVISCALQTIECDISRFDISLQSSVCNFDWKGSCHDHLIFHLAEGKFAGSSISTMESHECIFQCIIEFSFDGFFVHILRYGVVDIKQCNDIVAYYLSDELT